MAKKRTKTRVSSKIDELPAEVKIQVDAMLTDPGTTYANIADWLVGLGSVSYTHLTLPTNSRV